MGFDIRNSLLATQEFHSKFLSNDKNILSIDNFAKKIYDTLDKGSKIMSCGNGGSMCDSMHFAEELTGRFSMNRRALPAISIADPSHISCTANDYGYRYVFSRYIQALGQKGDMLLALSTSGNSENIVEALKAAREQNMYSFCLLGKDGGVAKTLCDDSIIVNHNESSRIQEIHITIIHTVLEAVEHLLFEI